MRGSYKNVAAEFPGVVADGCASRVDVHESTSAAASQLGAVVVSLEQAWQALRDHHRDLPSANIIIGGAGRSGRVLGYWSPARWRIAGGEASGVPRAEVPDVGEVMLSGEWLRRGAIDALATLVHEAAHALASARGIQDCSRQGRYHNRRYRLLAEEVGLLVERDPTWGWTNTTLAPETLTGLRASLDAVSGALRSYRLFPPVAERPSEEGDLVTVGSSRVARCRLRCLCGRSVSLTRRDAQRGPIVCGVCGGCFEARS